MVITAKSTLQLDDDYLLGHEITFATTSSNEDGRYDSERAAMLAYVSAWSYSEMKTFQRKLARIKELKQARFMEFSVVNDAMFVVAYAQVILTRDGSTAFVSFRGTQIKNVVNWLTDAGTRKVPFVGLSVHSGFLLNFQEVWQDGLQEVLLDPSRMFDNAADDQHPKQELQEIYMTGHSLGGAMAVLAALDMQASSSSSWSDTTTTTSSTTTTTAASSLWSKVKGIYTYGQPMVVDNHNHQECQQRIGNRLHRHVYRNDLIPHLPPLSTGAYDHFGLEYRFDETDRTWRVRTAGGGTCCDHLLFRRPRATQIVSVLAVLPFALADFALYNVQWLSGRRLLKIPWSLNDHSPFFYVT